MPTTIADRFSTCLADIAGCVRFFSRLPVPSLGAHDDPSHMPVFERAAWALPIAGLVIALPALAGLLALHGAGAPAMPAAFLFVGVLVFCTGGLHEDGLADMADGFGGGMSRERKLAIMKDSRIGAYGVLALVLIVGLKISAIAHLFANGGFAVFALQIVLAIMLSRFVMLFLWHALPNARTDGLSVMAGRPGRRAVEIAAGIVAIAVILSAGTLDPGALAGMAAAAFLAAALVGAMAMRHIGGQTGDILGAGQQIAEAAILTALALTAT